MNYCISLLFDLDKYSDRFRQIRESLPKKSKLIILTKNPGSFISNDKNIEIIKLENNLFNKSIFLKLKLIKLVYDYSKKGNVFILDWFMTFNFIIFVKYLFKNKVTYMYAPVIANYGWIYKRLKKIVPSVGIRYDYIRGKDSLQDLFTVKFCDILIVQSKALIDFYSLSYNVNKNKIKYNYNSHFKPNEIKISKKNELKKNIKLGFVGNLEKHKGIIEMLDIFTKLDSFNFEFYLVGGVKGKKNKEIFNKLISLKNVTHLGFLNGKELIDIYSEIDALLLFSYHEGSARVVREYVEFNKAIFMYDNPGMDYCESLEGVYIYKYEEIDKIVLDLSFDKWNKSYKRELPKYMYENNLKKIFGELLSE